MQLWQKYTEEMLLSHCCLSCGFFSRDAQPDHLIKVTSAKLVGFPGGSVVKNLPAMQESWAWSPGQEDPLEEEMATHSRILA